MVRLFDGENIDRTEIVNRRFDRNVPTGCLQVSLITIFITGEINISCENYFKPISGYEY